MKANVKRIVCNTVLTTREQDRISSKQQTEIDQLKDRQKVDWQTADDHREQQLRDVKATMESQHSTSVSEINKKHSDALQTLESRLTEEQRQHAVLKDHKAALLREKNNNR